MTFLAAGWLALSLPWAALVAWVWRRIAQEQATTAAFLWASEKKDVPRERTRRGRPPVWVIAALLAMLAAILSLASPERRGRAVRVAVVVDGSVSLAARVEGCTLRNALIAKVNQELAHSGQSISIDQRVIGLSPDGLRVLGDAQSRPFTARPTDAAIANAVADGLGDSDAVIVLTDKAISTKDDRVVVRVPATKAHNVGIESAIGVDRPRPSLMVTIANDSDRSDATLEVRMPALPAVRQAIALPARGERKKVFVDLIAMGDVIDIALVGMDDALSIDNSAQLFRTRSAPRLVVDAGAPEVAARFASAFDRAGRSGATAGAIVRLVDDQAGTPHADNEIVFAKASRDVAANDFRSTDHPILRDIDLSSPRIDRAARPPGDGWTTIASLGEAAVLAVREVPRRSVWIGFDLDPNDGRSVVLLANVVDWISESAASEWKGDVPESVGKDWKPVQLVDPTLDGSPGLYTDAAGRTVAVNVPAIVGPHGTSRGDIGELLRRADRATLVSLQKPLAFAAALLAGVAAALYGRRRVP